MIAKAILVILASSILIFSVQGYQTSVAQYSNGWSCLSIPNYYVSYNNWDCIGTYYTFREAQTAIESYLKSATNDRIYTFSWNDQNWLTHDIHVIQEPVTLNTNSTATSGIVTICSNKETQTLKQSKKSKKSTKTETKTKTKKLRLK